MLNCSRTHAESMTGSAHVHQEAHKLVGERSALAQQRRYDDLCRRDALEAATLLEDCNRTETAEGAEEEGNERKKVGQAVRYEGSTQHGNDETHLAGNPSTKQEELESVGELPEVCSNIVLKCLYSARIGRPDILHTFITQVNTDNTVMWATRLSIVDSVHSKTQILLATLRTQSQPG